MARVTAWRQGMAHGRRNAWIPFQSGAEYSVVMEKIRFDVRDAFPDFKPIFADKNESTLREQFPRKRSL